MSVQYNEIFWGKRTLASKMALTINYHTSCFLIKNNVNRLRCAIFFQFHFTGSRMRPKRLIIILLKQKTMKMKLLSMNFKNQLAHTHSHLPILNISF